MTASEADRDKLGYVEVEVIRPEGAVLKSKKPDGWVTRRPSIDKDGGLEVNKKVSYWYSFNRNERILKYGKGYFMEETALLTKTFPFPETEDHPDPWEFIFRPDETKEIDAIKGLMTRKVPVLLTKFYH